MKHLFTARQFLVWLGFVCLAVISSSPLRAQQPNLRDTLEGHTDLIASVAFSPDGKTLASGGSDETIRLWDVASGKNTTTHQTHAGVWCVAFSPHGQTLASGGSDKVIRLWDVATGKNTAALKGHAGSVQSIAFSPDGKTLASCSTDKTIRLWDLAGGK